MLGALHPPRGVAKPGWDSPQRHKLPAPFRQTVIARCRSLAQRAAPANTTVRRDPNLNGLRLPRATMQLHLCLAPMLRFAEGRPSGVVRVRWAGAGLEVGSSSDHERCEAQPRTCSSSVPTVQERYDWVL